MSAVDRSTRLDLWFAVAAGPGPWLDGQPLASVDQLVSTAGVASALVLSLAITSTAGAALQYRNGFECALFGVVLAVIVILLFGAVSPLTRFGPAVVIVSRAAAALGVLALSVKAFGSVQPLLLAGFGVPAGAQAVVTLRAIGAEVRWADALRRFMTSTVHAGMVTGVIILAILAPTQALRADVFDLTFTLYALLATTMLTLGVLKTSLGRIESAGEARVAAIRSAIHRSQAHWLHDDVCSELGNLRLRLQNGLLDREAVRTSLDDLDHRLRVRQVDEILEGGPARLGEIIQPYIRVAQSHGVELSDVPTYETGAMLLPPASGRQVQRAMAVLTTNAIQAGAHELAIRTSLEPGALVIEVEDDAGGFDVTRPIPGRGLDGLARDLGRDRLEIVRTPNGTLARVRVAMAGDPVSA